MNLKIKTFIKLFFILLAYEPANSQIIAGGYLDARPMYICASADLQYRLTLNKFGAFYPLLLTQNEISQINTMLRKTINTNSSESLAEFQNLEERIEFVILKAEPDFQGNIRAHFQSPNLKLDLNCTEIKKRSFECDSRKKDQPCK